MRFVDLTGRRFTRLVVQHRIPNRGTRTAWHCLCDCGNTKDTSGKNLVDEKVQSCDCLRSETCTERAKMNSTNNMRPAGESAFTLLFANYRKAAERRNFVFDLSEPEFRALTKGDCYYCGIEPYQLYGRTFRAGGYTYNGIDRRDNTAGYTKENCVSCCGHCNDMKRTRTEEKFIAACTAVVEHQKRRAQKALELSLPKLILTS